jgi:Zn-dependent protease with chaperone function
VWLGQASYSRQAEQEADAMAVQVLRGARLSPAVMVTLFDKLAEWRKRKALEGRKPAGATEKSPADTAPTTGRKAESKSDSDSLSWLGIAFASHPADAQRVRFFQDAARGSR